MIYDNIFKKYDIRGTYGVNLNEKIAYLIGYHFANLNISKYNRKIYVGYDGRISSPNLYKSLITGLKEASANIISIGLVPTPMLYFSDYYFNPAASIMVTASHNPKEDNGFKMVANNKPFFGNQIQYLKDAIFSINLKYSISGSTKADEEIDIAKIYINRLLRNIKIDSKLKIVWDPANGSSCNIIKSITKILPNKNIVINDIIDGNFPNHHANPSNIKNLKQLINIVISENADFGIAFDGDADRIGVVTKENIIQIDQLLCLFAEDILKQNPGRAVIADVKTSQYLFDYIKKINGNPLICKTGYPFVKDKIFKHKALLAGEISGHIFFSDQYYGFDDAIYAALRIIDLISRSKKKLDTIYQSIPKIHNTPEIRIVIKDKKNNIIELVRQKLIKEDKNFIDIDGIRVKNKNGWWLIRNSHTEDILVIRVEGNSEKDLEQQKVEISNILLQYNIQLKF